MLAKGQMSIKQSWIQLNLETRRTFLVVDEVKFWNSFPVRDVEAKIILMPFKTKVQKGVIMTWWLEQGADQTPRGSVFLRVKLYVNSMIAYLSLHFLELRLQDLMGTWSWIDIKKWESIKPYLIFFIKAIKDAW